MNGARGSFMLRGVEDSSEIKTIARWESLDDWKNFYRGENPSQMLSMRDLGKRTSVEIFEEVDDFTK